MITAIYIIYSGIEQYSAMHTRYHDHYTESDTGPLSMRYLLGVRLRTSLFSVHSDVVTPWDPPRLFISISQFGMKNLSIWNAFQAF